MPFLKVSFSTYDLSDHIQKNLHAQFGHLFLPVKVVLALLCCRIACLRRKSRKRRWIRKCHTTFVILLLFIILLITVLQFWHSLRQNASSESAPEVVVSIWQLQGVLNMLFLVYWDRHSVSLKLRQRLVATSTGIGVLRRKSLVNNIHLTAVISGTVISVTVITYRVLLIIFVDHPVELPLNFNLPHYFKWVFVGIFVYVAFSYPAIYAEVSSLVSVICAEYRALNDDFADDCNTYQLPVVKHYVAAHWKMSQSHALFNRSLSLWTSFHLLTSSFSCIFLWRSVPGSVSRLSASEPFTIVIFVCILLLIGIALSQLISSLAMCLLLRHHIIHFRYLLSALIASTKTLQEQAYSVAIAYINHLYRIRVGISFFEITIVDRRFIEQVATVSLLITAMYYFNNFDKCTNIGYTTTMPTPKQPT